MFTLLSGSQHQTQNAMFRSVHLRDCVRVWKHQSISNHDKPGRSPIVQWLRSTVHNHFREVIRVVVIACDERGNVSCYSFRMRCSITGFYGIPTARTCLAYMTTFRHGPLAEGGAVMELMTWAQLFNLYYVRLVWRLFMPASYVIMFNRYGAEFSHDEMA